jgi:methylenetetrahydrofolate dehydrogenase (NAD+)
VDVSGLAQRMRESVRRYTLQQEVRMVAVLAQSDSLLRDDAEVYSQNIAEAFAEDGLEYEVCSCSGDEPAAVEEAIRYLNQRSDVHGILVFYPIFKTRSLDDKGLYLNQRTGVHYKTYDDYLRDVVSPQKDVEALSHVHTRGAQHLFRARGMDHAGEDPYVPCTALAVSKIMEEYYKPLHNSSNSKWSRKWLGHTVTVVNRSEILGRPLAGLLSLQGATVYSVDKDSILVFEEDGRLRRCNNMELKDCIGQSSVIVSGVPTSDFSLPMDEIQSGTMVIDVSEGSCNVEEDVLLQKPNVQLVSNVGKVTVAALEQNLIRLHQQQRKPMSNLS